MSSDDNSGSEFLRVVDACTGPCVYSVAQYLATLAQVKGEVAWVNPSNFEVMFLEPGQEPLVNPHMWHKCELE